MSWRDHVTAALLGTERAGASPALPAALEETLRPGDGAEREARFLARAGALALWRRAGWRPAGSGSPAGTVAPPEEGTPLSPASRAHLDAMLAGHHGDLLPEWLAEAARRGRRLPPELLPALLERARSDKALRAPLLAAGGARARWLAEQQPPWRFAGDDLVPAHWETGSRDQRVAFLRGWRGVDPADAREKLAAVWKAESAEMRAAFLATLAEGLSGADEPLLERALDARGKEVRQVASDLLARLPGSAFVARMTARADALLAFKPGGLLRRPALEVTLPGEPDAATGRDGLDPKNLDTPRTLGGEKAAVLAHILGAVPLRHWQERFGQSPEVLLKAAGRDDFAAALISGWGLAATRQNDAAWVNALLEWPLTRNQHLGLVRNDELLRVLPPADQASRLLAAIRADPLRAKVEWTYQASWPSYFHTFAESPDALPVDLVRLVLAQLCQAAEPAGLPRHLRPLAELIAHKAPPALLAEIAANWPAEPPSMPTVASRLAFRRDALTALAQP